MKKASWQKTPLWLYVFCCFVALYIMLPVIIVAIMSFSGGDFLEFPPSNFSLRWYKEFFHSNEWLRATWNSTRIALGVVAISVTLGLLAALGITNRGMKKRKAFNTVLMIPLIIPPIIVAVAMYMTFGRWGLLGTYPGVLIGHACMVMPFVLILISSSLYGLDSRLYDAARVLGASHFRAIWLVVLPLIKPAIFSSILFAFIVSFDEVILSVFLVSTETVTLPKMMFDSLRFEITPIISSISTMLVALTISVLVFSSLSKSIAGRKK